jgi:hypothetical protein
LNYVDFNPDLNLTILTAMETKEKARKELHSNTILKLILTIIFIINVFSMQSQESILKLYPSFGVSFGFFNPKNVNNYIKYDLSNNNVITSTTSNMFSYYEGQGGLTLKLKFIDIRGFAEFATAPKLIIVTNGDSRSYFFNRTTLGASADFFIPLGTSKHSLFFGGGLTYNFLKFEGFRASDPGFRIQAGASLQFGKFNLQPYARFNYAKAEDKLSLGHFDLNYTGGQIGFIFSFHRP